VAIRRWGMARIVGKKDSSIPTLPFTPAQFQAVLRACTTYDLSLATVNKVEVRNKGKRLHALCNLMRWSGLAITDAVTLRRSRLGEDNRLVLYRTKTGNPVTVLLPPKIADELRKVPPGPDAHPDYFFWPGKGRRVTLFVEMPRSPYPGHATWIHRDIGPRSSVTRRMLSRAPETRLHLLRS
jgi:hypothetical protein